MQTLASVHGLATLPVDVIFVLAEGSAAVHHLINTYGLEINKWMHGCSSLGSVPEVA